MTDRQCRSRLFTRDEVYDSFFTAGSGDEDDGSNILDDIVDREDESDLFQDVVRPLDLVLASEAAQIETGANSGTISDLDQSRSRSTNSTHSAQFSYDASPESNGEEDEEEESMDP
ncbi:hypothetical protein PoB_001168100 [Plakobranchus ocellatus]|uniref:Uncharacterized protein n=1 Tax=Plakobranchus ocellatus TaxID=259542 RepID=A0AAV3YCW4_9GAST|nr:hypothetical protein PoB_001168100 [Plakobranchus ocellatus]